MCGSVMLTPPDTVYKMGMHTGTAWQIRLTEIDRRVVVSGGMNWLLMFNRIAQYSYLFDCGSTGPSYLPLRKAQITHSLTHSFIHYNFN